MLEIETYVDVCETTVKMLSHELLINLVKNVPLRSTIQYDTSCFPFRSYFKFLCPFKIYVSEYSLIHSGLL
jgi:hypothetical protein